MADKFLEYYKLGREMAAQRREQQVRNALAENYQGPTAEVPEQIVAAGAGQSEPTSIAAAPATPGGVNWNNALGKMYQSGLGPEAQAYEEKVYGPAKDKAKLLLEYQLKRALDEGRFGDAQRLMGGTGADMQPGVTMKITPRGTEVELDPFKAAQARRLDAEARDQGIYPGPENSGGGAPPNPLFPQGRQTVQSPQTNVSRAPGISPKQQREIAAKRVESQPEDLNRLTGAVYDLQRLGENADFLVNHPGLSTATGWTAAMGNIPLPTDAYGFTSGLETLKNKVVLNAMQSLKALSASGATGFGNLTEKEGARLENSIDTLNRAQKTEDIRAALSNVSQVSKEIDARLQDAYTNVYGNRPNLKRYSGGFRGAGAPATPTAPPAALDYLRRNNSPALRAQFKAKYGYLPEDK